MAKRRNKRPASKRPSPAASTAELERLLNDLERTMLAGQPPAPSELERLLRSPDRLAKLLTERLLTGRANVPMMALDLLNMFGGEHSAELLGQVAASPRVSDDVRFGAQRRLGWPDEDDEEADEDEAELRLEFLDSLRDPDGTLLGSVGVAERTTPPDAEILAEVLGYLEVLPDERCLALVEQLAELPGPAATLLLQAVLQLDDELAARRALAALVERRAHGAVGALQRLADTTDSESLGQEASDAARRLALRPLEPTNPLPPVDRVWLSLVDGRGGQALLLARRLDSGVNLVVNAYFDELWGIKTVSGVSPAPDELVDEMVEDSEEQGVSLVEVDLASARGALALAFDYNVARGLGVPPVFELWEPLLHDTYPPAPDETVERPELDDSTYAGRTDLLANAGELLEHPFFEDWTLDLVATVAALGQVHPPVDQQWGLETYQPLTEQIMDAEIREQLRQRLRRQAWILEQDGDDEARDLALATAAQLTSGTPRELVENELLRGLIGRTVVEVLTAGRPDDEDDEELDAPI
jgi:hypothetical protein